MADPLENLCRELCRVFLGWRLGEDRDALLALGEGALRIDLRSGECWYDEEPLPALFIAGELVRALEKAEQDGQVPPETSARLDAVFATRARGPGAGRVLDVAARVTLAGPGFERSAEARNDPDGGSRLREGG